jgi:hypothetical protein
VFTRRSPATYRNPDFAGILLLAKWKRGMTTVEFSGGAPP